MAFFFVISSLFLSNKSYAGIIKNDTLAVLRKSPPYNNSTSKTFPDFTYQSATDTNLTKLRNVYKLDEIAGKGKDIERAINLLGWFHNQVPHEDVKNIPLLTAENIIETYRSTKYAQGCYGLAIAMNEIFLSMGFNSRIVICFSNQYPFPKGGHVINSVYIPSLQKWIYMDPQENAYIKDEKGNFLSIAEVRQHLIDGRPLVLNSTANYHGVPTDKMEYLYNFMGTRMYRFICPVNSHYSSETRDGKTLEYVELLPYQSVEPPFSIYETQQTLKYRVVCFHTSNEKLFWQLP
ncbi:transglutaminase domain-containing protein [Chryseobacterium sp. Mn2064]|uniref:transglutaminase domain-containing protein n=1 Tax=Chryseobacterium sp. Mn2064 TaxID=3395263 RepID=UPI003BC359A2